jgi:spore coat polysaccharide biosynthesis protein SpsF (cytidylyltransferase family)/precorrin-6B methylase 2
MKKMIFVQADSRYNKFLLEKIKDKEIIKYTIDKVKEIRNVDKIIISTFKCEENKRFKELLNYQNDIILEYSEDENLTRRFMECIRKYSDIDIIIRVSGEQMFLDSSVVNRDIDDFIEKSGEFYFVNNNNGLYADIVKRNVLMKNTDVILGYDRFYKAFLDNKIQYNTFESIKEKSFINLFINDNLSFFFANEIINNNIKNIKHFCNSQIEVILKQIFSQDSFFITKGWIQSVIESSIIDENRNVIPWLPYSVIEFLSNRIKNDMVVFEYGSGNSTLWWQNKVKKIISVEHNQKYYYLLKSNDKYKNKENLLYENLQDGDSYETSILRTNEKYDIIVVDGRKRVKCAKIITKCLNEDGIIIWDNTDREYYDEGIQYIEQLGFKKMIFTGPGPMYSFNYHTTILYREQNCLNI